MPHALVEDIKDLFANYDQGGLGTIKFFEFKSILHYITGGVLKRKVLENYINELQTNNSEFDLKDVKKVTTKLWKDIGKEQHQNDTKKLLKSLEPYSNNTELEIVLKSRLSK